MTARASLRSVWLAFAAAGALFAAGASSAHADDLAGDWKFETGVFDGSCKITGSFRFIQTRSKDTYTCEFESEQFCSADQTSVKVRQSCTAQRIGKRVAIKSRVEEVIERKPDYGGSYYADNFIVSISRKGVELVGGHYDEIRTATARFWRELELLS